MVLTTTILSGIIGAWVAPSKAPKEGGKYYLTDTSSVAQNLTDRKIAILKRLEAARFVEEPMNWINPHELQNRPLDLWSVLYPGIASSLNDRVLFRQSGVTNGYSFQAYIHDTLKPTASSQVNDDKDLKFGYGDWRAETLSSPTSSIQEAVSLDKLAGAREYETKPGLSGIKGHKGTSCFNV
jgi:hypothetical protein